MPGRPSCGYEIRLIRDQKAFEAIAPAWDALADHLGNPLLRTELFLACLRSGFVGGRLHTVALYRDGALVAAAPLVLRRFLGVRRFEMISHALHEPSGFLYRDEEALRALIACLHGCARPFLIARLARLGSELRLLKGLAGEAGACLETDGATTLSIPLAADFAGLEARISASRRAGLRRLMKRARERGAVDFRFHAPTPGAVGPLLAEVFRVEGSGWKGRGGSSILRKARQAAFFEHYALALAERDMLRIHEMRLDGRTIAVRLAIAYGGDLYELKIGYDEAYRKLSPGILLFRETLRACCEQGIGTYHALGTAAAWQKIWPHREQDWKTLRSVPRSLAGAVILAGEAVRIALARARRLGTSVRPPQGRQAGALP